MEDPGVVHALKEEEDSTVTHKLTPPPASVTKPSVFRENTTEGQALFMASNEGCGSPAVASPTEASPAKPVSAFLTNGANDTSPTTSDLGSASDSITNAGSSSVSPTTDLGSPLHSTDAMKPVPRALLERNLPTTLTFNGVSVTLENSKVWTEFYRHENEMILAKHGRRMFPYCRYRLVGLEPQRSYSLFLSIDPADNYRHRWNSSEWETSGVTEYQTQGLSRAFPHHHSPALGVEWMKSFVSFYKLKLTNNTQDHEGHVLLHSMHRYIPRLHLIPAPELVGPGTPEQPLVSGPESMTFTFPQTEFYAVTSYQNLHITQLKIDHNPFARGFRDEAHSLRMGKPRLVAATSGRDCTYSPALKPARPNTPEEKNKEEAMTLNFNLTGCSVASPGEAAGVEAEPRGAPAESDAVTDGSGSTDGMERDDSDSDHVFHRQYLRAKLPLPSIKSPKSTPCQDTKQTIKLESPSLVVKTETPSLVVKTESPSLVVKTQSPSLVVKTQSPSLVVKTETPSLVVKTQSPSLVVKAESPSVDVVVTKSPFPIKARPLKPKEDSVLCQMTPEPSRLPRLALKPSPASSSPSPAATPPSPFAVPKSVRKKGRPKGGKRWGNSRGRSGSSAPPAGSPVAVPPLQPELDEVEGLLFVSFVSKEALGIHVKDMPPSDLSAVSPSPAQQPEIAVEAAPETEEEKIARLQIDLLHDIGVFKHRQVIHPVLQEVGLKLSSLDLSQAIDLQYLGVTLPLPPPVYAAEHGRTFLSPTRGGVPFVSRTGKTSDPTKIKGWREKFIRNKESPLSPQDDGVIKNRSAFMSDMLDEYLESEARQISERAAAFAAPPEGTVAYRLPAKSTSYVKTLDSVLKTRRRPAQPPTRFNRPCPLSRKSLLYSALSEPPPPLGNAGALPKAAPPKQHVVRAGLVANPARPAGVVGKPSAAMAKPKAALQSSPSVQKSPPAKTPVRRDTSPRAGQSSAHSQSTPANRAPSLNKSQLRLADTEEAAVIQGRGRTYLTEERLMLALSVMVTALGIPKAPPSFRKALGPECGKAFCRLGCVCSSLNRVSRGPLHCRRPECMLGCDCFKRTLTRRPTGEGQPRSVVFSYSGISQPAPGLHSKVLWGTHALPDADPVCTSVSAMALPPRKLPTARRYVPRPNPQVREEDKDPVYKYFESMMTCARVRGYTGKTVPQTPAPSPGTLIDLTAELSCQTAATPPPQQPLPRASKELEILSDCDWGRHRRQVLSVLCLRVRKNKLSPPFNIGPYRVRLLAKAFVNKGKDAVIAYKVGISKPTKGLDEDREESDSDDELVEEELIRPPPAIKVGVTPFQVGLLPSGRLQARKKQPHCPAVGLIEVNGKTYSQARLLLGKMGSLHPANRLAAFVTGRLKKAATKPTPPLNLQVKTKGSYAGPPAPVPSAPPSMLLQSIGSVEGAKLYRHPNGQIVHLMPIRPASTDTKARTANPIPANPKRPVPRLPAHSASSLKPVEKVTVQPSSVVSPVPPFHVTPSTTSTVSLTVSTSLKTPSFLGQRGTYSFRICPPNEQTSKSSAQVQPGVSLPGGFTLIRLPKPGASPAGRTTPKPVASAAPKSKPTPSLSAATSTPGEEAKRSSSPPSSVADPGPVSPAATGGARGPAVPLPSPVMLTCDEKMQSDESDGDERRGSWGTDSEVETDSDLDVDVEEYSDSESDPSLCDVADCGNEASADIETGKDLGLRTAIAKMRAAVKSSQTDSKSSNEDSESAQESKPKSKCHRHGNEADDGESKKTRQNHTVTERLRRMEQRELFGRLQKVLEIHGPRVSKIHILSKATREIRSLVGLSRYMEKQRKKLLYEQSEYVKEISQLSGKSEVIIRSKLKEIYVRQKALAAQMRMGAIAAPLRPIQPQPQPCCQHRIQPQLLPRPQHQAIVQPQLQLQNQHPHQTHVQPQPPQQSHVQPQPQPLHQTQVQLQPQNQAQSQPQNQAQSQPQNQAQPNGSSRKPRPIILSKTGRVLHPSSLKPAGPGLYTLKVGGVVGHREFVASFIPSQSPPLSTPPTLVTPPPSALPPPSPLSPPTDPDPGKDQEPVSPTASETVCNGPANEKDEADPRAAQSTGTGHVILKSPFVEISRLSSTVWREEVELRAARENGASRPAGSPPGDRQPPRSLRGGRGRAARRSAFARAADSIHSGAAKKTDRLAPVRPPDPSSIPKRGRPRKELRIGSSSTVKQGKGRPGWGPVRIKRTETLGEPAVVVRGRGRPRKNKPGVATPPAGGDRLMGAATCASPIKGPSRTRPVTRAGASPAEADSASTRPGKRPALDSPGRATRSGKRSGTKDAGAPPRGVRARLGRSGRRVTRSAAGKDSSSAKKSLG